MKKSKKFRLEVRMPNSIIELKLSDGRLKISKNALSTLASMSGTKTEIINASSCVVNNSFNFEPQVDKTNNNEHSVYFIAQHRSGWKNEEELSDKWKNSSSSERMRQIVKKK